MQIEHVAGVRFTSGRTADEKRKGTVRGGVLTEVVVNDQHVFSVVHEEFAHRTAGIRRDVLQGRKLGGRCGDDDGVVHRAGLIKRRDKLCNRRALLADGDVDADDVLALLVDDGVGRERRLTGLAVADDELALAAADRDHGVDGLDTGLKRNGDALALQDAGGRGLDGGEFLRLDGALAVNRLTQRVNDASDELVADGDGDDTAGAADGVALADALFVTQHNDGNGVFLQVLRHAVHAAGELQQLVDHTARQTCGLCDAVADQNDGAGLGLVDLCFIVFDLRTDDS